MSPKNHEALRGSEPAHEHRCGLGALPATVIVLGLVALLSRLVAEWVGGLPEAISLSPERFRLGVDAPLPADRLAALLLPRVALTLALAAGAALLVVRALVRRGMHSSRPNR